MVVRIVLTQLAQFVLVVQSASPLTEECLVSVLELWSSAQKYMYTRKKNQHSFSVASPLLLPRHLHLCVVE